MVGNVRRFAQHPGLDVITAIEGVTIIDQSPPGVTRGRDTGCVAIVGEFADVRHAVRVNTSGVVVANLDPVEVYSQADVVGHVGGWDETLGNFGAQGGNGYVTTKHPWSRLVLAPIDNITPAAGSTYGVRLCRDLPTNRSATDARPIVPIEAASVSAAREFGSGNTRVRLAQTVQFYSDEAYASGVDGAVTADGAASTAAKAFDSATGAFVANGVRVGDILVVGVLSAAGAQGANAGTYRVTAVTDADTVMVEKIGGTSFDWTTGTALAWRLHAGRSADTAASVAGATVALSGVAGYVVPARPLAASVANATSLAPAVVPPAGSATSWDSLSGLFMRTHPTGDTTNSLIYDANVHAPNLASNSTLLTRYQNAIDALLADRAPTQSINIVLSARKVSGIRTYLRAHALAASARGLTRRTVLAPELTTLTMAAVVAATDPGVGANRSDRVDYAWPGLRMFVPEAVGFTIPTADGSTTTDGYLDESADVWMASIQSNLPPERNPGQSSAPVPLVMSSAVALQRGAPVLGVAEYVSLRGAGIAAPRYEPTQSTFVFQSGVTTSSAAAEKNISTRRMRDYIQDRLAAAMVPFTKELLSQQLKDAAVGEVHAILTELKSPGNPAASRITDFAVDDQSGNTPDAEARGVFVIIVRVRLTPSADFIVLQTEIGESVQITDVAA